MAGATGHWPSFGEFSGFLGGNWGLKAACCVGTRQVRPSKRDAEKNIETGGLNPGSSFFWEGSAERPKHQLETQVVTYLFITPGSGQGACFERIIIFHTKPRTLPLVHDCRTGKLSLCLTGGHRCAVDNAEFPHLGEVFWQFWQAMP